MAPITHSIDIDRAPEDVFAYLDDLERHVEWQEVERVTVQTEGPTRVGTKVVDRRTVPGGARDIPYEVTAHDPPRSASFRGTGGPVRPVGTVTVAPLDGGRSRVTLELDLQGYGLVGKLMAPLARRQARSTVPGEQQRLKERLEASSA